jgi:hypothetical protein
VADEVRVVLVKTGLAPFRDMLVPAPSAFGEDALAGLILRDDLA